MIDAVSNGAVSPGFASAATGGAAHAESADFGSVLGQLTSWLAGRLEQGEAAAIAGIQGSLPVQQAVERIMDAERTLQAVVAVRDKLVGAYLEISRMQI
jgi:flagellar hook-basal body complex protein FliE